MLEPDLSMIPSAPDNAQVIEGGNIVVPHARKRPTTLRSWE